LSSTAASIILNADGSINMVLGGSGGSRIFPSLASVLLNLQCGLNLSEAVERPRVHNQIVPNLTTLEVGPEGVVGEWKDLVKGLEARGHKVGLFDINIAISEGKLASFIA
jgi:gamma-glutamyltranspeptidase/glutathione hydrolase/leukotriene-C4 hydrolase